MSVVYQSLTRPKLHRGAEWKLSTANNLCALVMVIVFLAAHTWWALLFAAIFYWPGQWILRMVAKHDPHYLSVYLRALEHPLILEPNGYRVEAKPVPVLPSISTWVK